jgi:hypothetical protein
VFDQAGVAAWIGDLENIPRAEGRQRKDLARQSCNETKSLTTGILTGENEDNEEEREDIYDGLQLEFTDRTEVTYGQDSGW